jgi:hypothetical protein
VTRLVTFGIFPSEIQIRGSLTTTRALKELNLQDGVELGCPTDCKNILSLRIRSYVLTLMRVEPTWMMRNTPTKSLLRPPKFPIGG